MLAAYEFETGQDFDPPLGQDEPYVIGYTVAVWEDAPIRIYLETIRDIAANLEPEPVTGAPLANAELIRQRAVLHETMHRFGHLPHDEAIMLTPTVVYGTDEENVLTGTMLREIMTRSKP